METKTYPQIIALYSPAPQMGKSTAAAHLQQQYGYTPYKFAGPMKSMLSSLLMISGLSSEQIANAIDGAAKDQMLPIFGKSARQMMQTLGTDWGRKMVDPDIWTNIAKQAIGKLTAFGMRVVIDDMRFPNEYETLETLGATMIYIVRNDIEIPPPSHASEGCLDLSRFDHRIAVPLGIHNVTAAIDNIMEVDYA